MTFVHTIDESRGLIFVRLAGSLGADAFIECMEKLWADPAYRRHYNGIADITGLRGDYSMDDLRRVIGFMGGHPNVSDARWAVVAASPLVVASAYLYQRAIAPVHQLEVFSTWEAAAKFIGGDLSVPIAV